MSCTLTPSVINLGNNFAEACDEFRDLRNRYIMETFQNTFTEELGRLPGAAVVVDDEDDGDDTFSDYFGEDDDSDSGFAGVTVVDAPTTTAVDEE